jgi:hypothetical protein
MVYHGESRIIIYAWVNDGNTKRAYESGKTHSLSGRESTALGQSARRSPRNEFHQKIDEGTDLER